MSEELKVMRAYLFGAWGGRGGVGWGGSVKEETATYPKPFEGVESWNLVIDGCGA